MSVAYGDEAPQAVAPENGVITLTIKGAGFAIISNVLEGVKFTIEEAAVNGWELVSSVGASGTIVADETLAATFTNTEKVEEEEHADDKGDEKTATKAMKAEGGTSGGGMAQTGDSLPALPFAALALASLLVLLVARKKQRDC